MEEYHGLTNPLVDGVFVADGKSTIANPYANQMQDMGQFIASLRQNYEVPDLIIPQPKQEEVQNQDYLSDMNLSFPELLKQEGLNIIVTSELRPGAKTKQGRTSHHSHKDEWGYSAAIDFRAADGNYTKLLNDIYSNPRIKAWLVNHGKGIIEETSQHPGVRKSTGADKYKDGLLHLGPDKLAIQMSSKYINYGNNRIIPSNKNVGKTGIQRLKYVKNYLMQNFGLDDTHASALAGVWYAESNLNPGIKSKRDSGSGIAQWTGSRHQEFNRFYRQVFGKSSPGITNTSLEEQIHVAIAEYKARKNNWNDFLRRTDLQGATDSVLRGYENGGGRLASIADIDRIYTRNGSGSYKKLMSDRLAFAKQALN